ncbi:hypothetical protein CPB85DRAFT_1334622 [Mucidula mucida]|nr:hypothetical protein CPB85DRAFT_1334622 [Mucidula mucida]
MSLPLPPELVHIIAEHLLYENPYLNKRTLQSCALVARTWAMPCQRVLFQQLGLYDYLPVVRLSAHLTRYPHLRRLIRDLEIHTASSLPESEQLSLREKYLSCLAALFPLMSCVTSLAITFDRRRPWDAHDQRAIEAFRVFVRTSKCLQALTIREIQDEAVDFQQMFSILEGANVPRVTFETDPFQPRVHFPVPFFDPTLTVVHLPMLETLRLDSYVPLEICGALKFWFCQWPAMFPNLTHLEIVINSSFDLDDFFPEVLRPAALRLDSFRLELMRYCLQCYSDRPRDMSLFEGLQYKHFKLCIADVGTGISEAPALLINWISSSFRHLTDSATPIHFRELTFTFSDADDLETTSVEWETLDKVLSHGAFAGVQRIHFEVSGWDVQVTEKMHPELVSVIRRTLPCLSSRGVLSFL